MVYVRYLDGGCRSEPIPDFFGLPTDVAVPASIAARYWSRAIRQPRWVFRAEVSPAHVKRFVGYGDADPIQCSPLGLSWPRCGWAETRGTTWAPPQATVSAGICSVEGNGSPAGNRPCPPGSQRSPPQPVNGKNGNWLAGPKVHLLPLASSFPQHQLDANPVSPMPWSSWWYQNSSVKPPASRSKALLPIWPTGP